MDFFLPGTSYLHRFDPRAKLLLLAPLAACFLFPVPPWVQIPYVIAVAIVIATSLGFAELAKPLRLIAPILVLICILTPPFHTSGQVLVRLFSLPFVTVDGLQETATMVVRFIGITLSFYAVFRSIDLDELSLSMRWFGLPYGLCLIVVIAFRYIPSLGAVYHNVLDAHRLRSEPVPEALEGGRSLAARLRIGTGRRRKGGLVETYVPVLTSMLIQAVKGIPVLAMVLESRGFGRQNRRTAYAALNGGRILAAHMLIALGIAAVLIVPVFIRWY